MNLNERAKALTQCFVSAGQQERSLWRLGALALAVFVLFSTLAPRTFFSGFNFQTIAFSAPEIGLLGLAMMVAMLAGGIDLSVVPVANLSALTVALLFQQAGGRDADGVLLTVGIVLAGLLVGVVAGALNGTLVAVVGIAPILATLGTMQLFDGLNIIVTGGEAIYGMSPQFAWIGNGTIGGVPVSFVILVLAAIGVAVFVGRTPLGMSIRFVGGNATAARFSGVPNNRVIFAAHVVSALLAGVSGIIIASRAGSASADYGGSYLLLALVIAVLGGTNPNGGFATVTGIVLATATLQMLSSGFNILRLSPFTYTMTQGLILVVIMMIDARRNVPSIRLRRRSPARSRGAVGAAG